MISWGLMVDGQEIPCDSRQEAHQRKREVLADGCDHLFVEVYSDHSVAREQIISVIPRDQQ